MIAHRIEQGIIYANGLRIGFVVRDEDGDHVNLSGVTAVRVPAGKARRWLRRHIGRYFPACREYQLEQFHLKRYEGREAA